MRQPRRQGPERPAVGIQDARKRLLPGAVVGDRPVLGHRVRADCAGLLPSALACRGRFPGLHRPPAPARHLSLLHSND